MTGRAVALGVSLALVGCGAKEWPFDDEAEAGEPRGIQATPGVDAHRNDASVLDSSQDDSNGRSPDAPLGCRSDEDCALTTLHCDVVLGQCVACINSLQCTQASLPRCDFALHRCVQCGVNDDCRLGQVCEPTTEQCVFSCADGGLCPDGAPYCSEPRSVCVRCTTNPDCWTTDSARICNASSGQCVECIVDGDCPNKSPLCDGTTNSCVECLGDVNCGRGRVCDPVAHKCLSPTK